MGIFDVIPAILTTVSSVVSRVVPDANQQAQLTAEIQKALIDRQAEFDQAVMAAAKAQADVNLAEAQSPSMFVAGWRPFVGWVCGIGFAYCFILQPVFSWAASVFGLPTMPTLDTSALMTLMLGMLGMGGMRTYEKLQGVDRQNMNPPVVAKKK